jgi:peroxiredoxin
MCVCPPPCAGRQTFVFDASGKCLLSFNAQMDVLRHVDEALAVLKGQCSATGSS